MPVPKPSGDEKKDDFISRCMGDEKMNSEYPDQEQRAAICYAQFTSEAAGTVLSEMFSKDGLKTLDAEIFAAGKWNGMDFSDGMLDSLVATFNKLHDIHKVPLKFGHNSQQKMTDGQPALGWVEKIWREGGKLMAKFTDMPEIVMKAMKKKLYRKVSIELDVDVKHGTDKYDYVLSGVALLGADIPAVNVLADLHAYMSKGASPLTFTNERLVLSSFSNTGGDPAMDNVDDLKKEVARLSVELAQEKAKSGLLLVEKENFSRRETEREESEKRNKLAALRKEINEWCETTIKSGLMLPAQREMFKVAICFDDDKRLLDANIEGTKSIFSVKKDVHTSDHGGGSGTSGNKGDGEDATKQVIRMTRDRMSQFKENWDTAIETVLRNDADLARRYGDDMNKEVA